MTAEQHKLKNEIAQAVAPFGFSLQHYDGSGKLFYFIRPDSIGLDIIVKPDGKWHGKLSFITGLFTVSSGEFSWPHPRFETLFLKRIQEISQKLQS